MTIDYGPYITDSREEISYKSSGVDIKKADEFVGGIKLSTPKFQRIPAFASLFELRPFLKKYKNPVLVSSTDGVGTKLKIAAMIGIHNTVGIDLVAMNVNDVVCIGAKPLYFLDYIACGKVDIKILKEVLEGINKGLEESKCVLIGGETAEMPGMYKEDEYDLAGFCVGIVDRDKIIDGRRIKDGDAIIGLESNGLHSNGFSLARKVLGEEDIKRYGKELINPTRIYVKPILSLLSTRYSLLSAVRGIAHITGGAFFNKATKILPEGFGMKIYKKNWNIPSIFKIIQDKGKIKDKEMYSVFNMGIGMMLAADNRKVDKIRQIISEFKIKTFVLGEIAKSKEKMEII